MVDIVPIRRFYIDGDKFRLGDHHGLSMVLQGIDRVGNGPLLIVGGVRRRLILVTRFGKPAVLQVEGNFMLACIVRFQYHIDRQVAGGNRHGVGIDPISCGRILGNGGGRKIEGQGRYRHRVDLIAGIDLNTHREGIGGIGHDGISHRVIGLVAVNHGGRLAGDVIGKDGRARRAHRLSSGALHRQAQGIGQRLRIREYHVNIHVAILHLEVKSPLGKPSGPQRGNIDLVHFGQHETLVHGVGGLDVLSRQSQGAHRDLLQVGDLDLHGGGSSGSVGTVENRILLSGVGLIQVTKLGIHDIEPYLMFFLLYTVRVELHHCFHIVVGHGEGKGGAVGLHSQVGHRNFLCVIGNGDHFRVIARQRICLDGDYVVHRAPDRDGGIPMLAGGIRCPAVVGVDGSGIVGVCGDGIAGGLRGLVHHNHGDIILGAALHKLYIHNDIIGGHEEVYGLALIGRQGHLTSNVILRPLGGPDGNKFYLIAGGHGQVHHHLIRRSQGLEEDHTVSGSLGGTAQQCLVAAIAAIVNDYLSGQHIILRRPGLKGHHRCYRPVRHGVGIGVGPRLGHSHGSVVHHHGIHHISALWCGGDGHDGIRSGRHGGGVHGGDLRRGVAHRILHLCLTGVAGPVYFRGDQGGQVFPVRLVRDLYIVDVDARVLLLHDKVGRIGTAHLGQRLDSYGCLGGLRHDPHHRHHGGIVGGGGDIHPVAGMQAGKKVCGDNAAMLDEGASFGIIVIESGLQIGIIRAYLKVHIHRDYSVGHLEGYLIAARPLVGHRVSGRILNGDGLDQLIAGFGGYLDLQYLLVKGGDGLGAAGGELGGTGPLGNVEHLGVVPADADGTVYPQGGVDLGLVGPCLLKKHIHHAIGRRHDKVHRLRSEHSGNGIPQSKVGRGNFYFRDVISIIGMGIDHQAGPRYHGDGIAVVGSKPGVARLGRSGTGRRPKGNVGHILPGLALAEKHLHACGTRRHGKPDLPAPRRRGGKFDGGHGTVDGIGDMIHHIAATWRSGHLYHLALPGMGLHRGNGGLVASGSNFSSTERTAAPSTVMDALPATPTASPSGP